VRCERSFTPRPPSLFPIKTAVRIPPIRPVHTHNSTKLIFATKWQIKVLQGTLVGLFIRRVVTEGKGESCPSYGEKYHGTKSQRSSTDITSDVVTALKFACTSGRAAGSLASVLARSHSVTRQVRGLLHRITPYTHSIYVLSNAGLTITHVHAQFGLLLVARFRFYVFISYILVMLAQFVPYYCFYGHLSVQEFLPWCSSSTSEINWNWNKYTNKQTITKARLTFQESLTQRRSFQQSPSANIVAVLIYRVGQKSKML